MSKYWDLHCKPCDVHADIDINRGDHILRSMLKVWPHIRAALKEDTTGYLEVSTMGYGSAAFDFLREHDGHDIEIRSEYGDVAPLEEQQANDRQEQA